MSHDRKQGYKLHLFDLTRWRQHGPWIRIRYELQMSWINWQKWLSSTPAPLTTSLVWYATCSFGNHFIFNLFQHPRVRFACCNALGQMATDFAPVFEKKFHDKVIPGLLHLMDDNGNPRVQAHAGAALVNFSEDCPKNILTQVPSVTI